MLTGRLFIQTSWKVNTQKALGSTSIASDVRRLPITKVIITTPKTPATRFQPPKTTHSLPTARPGYMAHPWVGTCLAVPKASRCPVLWWPLQRQPPGTKKRLPTTSPKKSIQLKTKKAVPAEQVFGSKLWILETTAISMVCRHSTRHPYSARTKLAVHSKVQDQMTIKYLGRPIAPHKREDYRIPKLDFRLQAPIELSWVLVGSNRIGPL